MKLSLDKGTVVGRDFRIVSFIAAGGDADIYLAEQTSVASRQVVVKLLNDLPESLTERWLASHPFFKEGRILGMLKSGMFPAIFQAGVHQKVAPYLAMEYLTGAPLSKLVEKAKPVPLSQILVILEQLAIGLTELHALDIVHRDLKPSNVMLLDIPSVELRVKILDLGHAQTHEDSLQSGSTRDYVGTPAYMSPEQAMGKQADVRTDVYGLASIVYELLTGVRPINLKLSTPQDYVDYLKSDKPIPIYPMSTFAPSIPGEVEQVVERALQRNRKHRFESVQSFYCAFLAALSVHGLDLKDEVRRLSLDEIKESGFKRIFKRLLRR